jgi:hypothetical protein
MLADGTTCRLSQHELRRPVLAGFFGKKPIERNLSIIRMTVLAGFDLLFGLQSLVIASTVTISMHGRAQISAIEATLQCPLVGLFIVTEAGTSSLRCPEL